MSSLKLTSKTILGKDQLKRVKNILQSLVSSNDSTQFRTPVDWKGLGLVDYGYLIKNPMDLGTITTKINNQKYIYVEEVLDDIQLIWDNCKLYNAHGTWIYNLSQKLERAFKKMVKNYLPNISIVVPGSTKYPYKGNFACNKQDRKPLQNSLLQNQSPEQISYNEKVKFSDRLKTLTPEQLGTIVELIIEKCPTAFKQINDQNAQLLIDNLDFKIYREVNCAIETLNASFQDRIIKKVKLE